MDKNINIFQRALEIIIGMGYTVVEIFPIGDSTALYYIVHKFIPATSSTVEDIQYNQLVGINITDLLINNSSFDKTAFEHRISTYIQDANVVRLEFPNAMRWLKLSYV
jgi:hypothetical protein